jgi:hypothetical protein
VRLTSMKQPAWTGLCQIHVERAPDEQELALQTVKLPPRIGHLGHGTEIR